MRTVQSSKKHSTPASLWVALPSLLALQCGSMGETDRSESGLGVDSGQPSATSPASTLHSPATPTPSGTNPTAPTSSPSGTAFEPSPSVASNPEPTTAPQPSEPSSGDPSAGGSSSDPTPEPESNPEPQPECTDTPPDERESCATWAEWGECESGWIKDEGFCKASCGRCDAPMSMPSPNGPGPTSGPSEPGQPSEPSEPGPNNPSPTGPGLGNDNPYTPISGGQRGVSTRYWDCCKQGCSWTGKQGTPVDSCNLSGQNIGVNDQVRSSCEGGDGQTCHGMAPWAYSSQVAYGYAAVNAASCGSCWQLQFTGSSQSAGSDPGSQAIAGKTMIVMATNTGDIGAHHFDILIPGGGWGQNEGCARSLGIQNLSELGSQRGGMLTACAGAGSHDAKKQCVRDMCTRAFGSRGLSDLETGCLWFVDWFQVADNPDFEYKQIDCPSELREFN